MFKFFKNNKNNVDNMFDYIFKKYIILKKKYRHNNEI